MSGDAVARMTYKGSDVKNATINKRVVDMDHPLMKIHDIYKISIDSGYDSTYNLAQVLNFPLMYHGLGYVPRIVPMIRKTNHADSSSKFLEVGRFKFAKANVQNSSGLIYCKVDVWADENFLYLGYDESDIYSKQSLEVMITVYKDEE